QPERHRPLLQVGVQPPESLQVRLLHDIRWVYAAAQLGVEAQLDQLLQVGPVPGEKVLEGLWIAGLSLLEQALRLRRVGLKLVHQAVSSPTNSETAPKSTAAREKRDYPSPEASPVYRPGLCSDRHRRWRLEYA